MMTTNNLICVSVSFASQTFNQDLYRNEVQNDSEKQININIAKCILVLNYSQLNLIDLLGNI